MEAEEVLELTDPLPEPEPERVETHGDLEVHEAELEPELEVEREPVPEPVMAADVYDEPLVSNPTADQTATSFGHLARSVAMPKGGRTLEDVVRELLRPAAEGLAGRAPADHRPGEGRRRSRAHRARRVR